MLLADVLAQVAEVVDHPLPAVVAGIVAEHAALGGLAVAALVVGVERVAGAHQRFGEAGVAAAVFGHAVGQHQHCAGRAVAEPAVDEQGDGVAGGQPEVIVAHGGSLCRMSTHCACRRTPGEDRPAADGQGVT
ncbi:hypothetical protein D9M69_447670 [compost metagenome]